MGMYSMFSIFILSTKKDWKSRSWRFLKNALTDLWKGQGGFSRLPWTALPDIVCSMLLYTASLIKNRCHVSNGLCANALRWTHPCFLPSFSVQPLKRFWKERFTAFSVSFCLSISLKREGIFSLIHYVYIRARVIILRYTLSPFSFHPQNLSFQPLWESAICKKVWKNLVQRFGGYVLKQ